MPTTATPTLLSDPGYIFYAPLLTSIPTNTVSGSKFTDAWSGSWISAGATEDGSEFTYSINVEAMSVAEFFDPVKYATTERSGTFSWNMADWTLTKLKLAMNGGTLTVVSGTGATQLNKYVPPAPGAEVRQMLGWESLDSTVRLIVYQALSGGDITMSFAKAPDYATIPVEFQFEVPTGGQPFEFYSAGTARA
jgi:hypothetical protein